MKSDQNREKTKVASRFSPKERSRRALINLIDLLLLQIVRGETENAEDILLMIREGVKRI